MTATKHKAHTVQPAPAHTQDRQAMEGILAAVGVVVLLIVAVLVRYVRWRLTWGRIGRENRAAVQKGQ